MTAGLLTYVLEIIVVTSFTALVFSDRLAGQLPLAIGFILAGDAALCAVVALLSSYPGSVAIQQDAPSAVVAVAVASTVAALGDGVRPEQQFATVLMTIVGTTMASGAIFVLLGAFRLGALVRFLPFPVMGGFLGGTGWLLATGAVGVMTDAAMGPDLFLPVLLWHWLPGLALGLFIWLAVTRLHGSMVLPSCVAGGIIVFYLIAGLAGASFETLQRDGWLLGSFPSGALWQFPLSAETLSQTNWSVLAASLPQVFSAALIGVIALLLNVSGLELVIKRDVDSNRELVVAGLGNLASGLAGGIVGYHALSLSSLNHSMAGGRRLPALIAAFLLAVTVVVGASALTYVPNLILGALLFFVGLSFLYDWVWRAWFKFPKADTLVTLLIVGVIATRGFLDGVVVGLVLTVLVFVVNYSRIGIVKHELSGRDYRSRVTRDHREQQVLDAHGDEIYVLKLQGFLFFGTAGRLYQRIRTRVGQTPASVAFTVLDFGQVTGLDSTGLIYFERMKQSAAEMHMTLLISGASRSIREQFERDGLTEQPGILHFFPSLDDGLEWGENETIARYLTERRTPKGMVELLLPILPMRQAADALMRHMERREVGRGEYLIRQGEAPDSVFFVECGQVTAQLEAPEARPVRLQTMRGGNSVGEIGFYLGTARTAAVIADEPSVVYGISRRDLEKIEKNDPEAASALHRVVVHLLAERVAHLTRVVQALER